MKHAQPVDLPGRISGDESWRASRGELGSGGSNDGHPVKYEDLIQEFNFPETNVELNYVGSCKYVPAGKFIQLTPNSCSQAGAVWYLKPITVSKTFAVRFQFQIMQQAADGFAFVLVICLFPNLFSKYTECCFSKEQEQRRWEGTGEIKDTLVSGTPWRLNLILTRIMREWRILMEITSAFTLVGAFPIPPIIAFHWPVPRIYLVN